MTEMVARLRRAYRQQQALYEEVLRLAQEGARRARAGEVPAGLQEIHLRKRECLVQVEQLEREIAADKQAWRDAAPGGPEARELHAMLMALTDLIQRILECERETDRGMLQGVAGEPSHSAQGGLQ